MEQFVNHAVTVLTEETDPFQTKIMVNAPDSFPTEPEFRILVGMELMLVRDVQGRVWTVDRGIEGTPTLSHDAGSRVAHTLTAEGLRQLVRQEVEAILSRPMAQALTPARFLTFTDWCNAKSL